MKKTILFFLISILLINSASAFTFTNIGKDFKIEYPTGWSYIEEPDGTDQTFSSQTGRAWVKVVVEPSEGMSLDEIVGDRIRYLNSLGIYPFNEKYVTIGGVTGKELMFYEDYQQKEYKERQILILSGDNYFIITDGSLTSDYPFFSDDMDKIINSFTLIKPTITPKGTALTPTPVETVKELSASVSLHREKTNVVVGEDVLLRLSVVNLITKPVMSVQVIIKPPSGMSVSSTEFTQGAAGQYTSTYKLEPGATRDIEVRLKPNEIGDFTVEGWVVYYFGDDITSKKEEILKEPITVRSAGEITSTITPQDGGTSDGSSIILGLIAIIAMIFMAYVIFNKIYKTFKNVSGKAKTPTAAEVYVSEVDDSLPPHIEEDPVKIEPRIEKESAFEAEKRKQHSLLPPENLDIDTRNYLSFGLNTAISMLDAEIAKAENDALQMQGVIKKDEDVLGNLGSRLVNKEISDQTYNDLKNKYMGKISELKSKVMNLESGSAKLKKIRSFIHEKGKYYE
ncbi:Uncharacterised protein [uncultured archaeon]|nr:Uncharacterised protein [uncultured archaeon]